MQLIVHLEYSSTDGQNYSNNSVIRLNKIFGISYDIHSLMCVTERRPCCSSSASVTGEWYYPNKTTVPSFGAGFTFIQPEEMME